MFGVPIQGPVDVCCENQSPEECKQPGIYVVKDVQCNQLLCSSRSEPAAAGILRVGKEDSLSNLADGFTKVLTADRRNSIFETFMYQLH